MAVSTVTASQEEPTPYCSAEADTIALAKKAVRAGVIKQDVLDHLTSLQPQVPSSMKHRYLLQHLKELIRDNIDDDHYFAKIVQVLVEFQPNQNLAVINSMPFGPEHISDLVEFLAEYAFKWELLGTALKFKPQDLNNIKASHTCTSMTDPLMHSLKSLIEHWIGKKHKHTLPPTKGNLESALRSNTVGLGALANKLPSIASLPQLPIHSETLPYLIYPLNLSVTTEGLTFTPPNIQNMNIRAEENGSVLLEVQATFDDTVAQKPNLKYQWLMNEQELSESVSHTGTATPILCISNADIDMDGSKYQCAVTAHIDDIQCSITTQNVTLRVICPLDQFSSDLATIYKVKSEVPIDTCRWPPVSSKKYINLALIRQEQIKFGTQHVHPTFRGDMDDILQCKEVIEYDKVFKSLKCGQVIFIEGRPGSGKTTFVHKITQDWAITMNRGMRLVLLVSLRVLNKRNVDLTYILKLFMDLKVDKELIEERKGKGVCFIFDGLDEYTPHDPAISGEKSIIHRIIDKEYLNQSTVIVASRPAAIAELQYKADKVIEVIGFKREQIFEYFDHYPFSDKSKSAELKTYLSDHPNILHMCYMPVHASMVGHIFQVAGEVPQTETEIYTHFTHLTLKRNFAKNGDPSGEERRLNQICRFALEITIHNEQVLHQNEVKSLFKDERDGDISLGLIATDCTASMYGFEDVYTFLHLTFQEYLAARHISTLNCEEQDKLIQEHGNKQHMLAVWKFYCGLMKHDATGHQFKSILQTTQGRMNYKIQCAYESQQQTACDLIIKHLNASIQLGGHNLVTPDYIAIGYVMAKAPVPLSLSLTGFELKDETIRALLSKKGEKKWLLHTLQCSVISLDETQIICIGRLVSNVKSLQCLCLDARCKSADHNLDAISNAAGTLRTSIVEFNAQKISVGPKFLKMLLSPAQCLHKLILIESIGTAEVKVLSSCLKNCKNLRDLNINCNYLQDSDATLLAEGLEFCTRFETISMSRNKFERKGTTDILQSLKNAPLNIAIKKLSSYPKSQFCLDELSVCRNLQELHLNILITKSMSHDIALTLTLEWQKLHTLELDHIEIQQVDDLNIIASNIACGFKNLKSLEVLKIMNSSQHFSVLSCGLKYCTGLKTLDISKNFITHKEVLDLANGLSRCKKIQNLNLRSNNITDSAVEAVLTSIKNKANFRSLNLHHNKITAKGGVAVSISLRHCKALTLMDLGKNKIGKEGANEISKCFQHWPNLQTLDLSGQILPVKIESNIGRDGAMVIVENLHHCTQLENVSLSHNNICDDDVIEVAVQKLAQCEKLIRLDFLCGNGITKDKKSVTKTIFHNIGVELL